MKEFPYLLNGTYSYWEKSSAVDENHLNFIIEIEKKLTNLLKELKASETISEIDYKKIKPRGPVLGCLYGLCKARKNLLDRCPPFRSILSAIKTLLQSRKNFSYLIKPIAKNKFRVKKLNSLRKYVNKPQNTLWPVLTLSHFSPI